jgi:hypothetical protein
VHGVSRARACARSPLLARFISLGCRYYGCPHCQSNEHWGYECPKVATQTEQESERVFYTTRIASGEGGGSSVAEEYMCRARCSQQCWKVLVSLPSSLPAFLPPSLPHSLTHSLPPSPPPSLPPALSLSLSSLCLKLCIFSALNYFFECKHVPVWAGCWRRDDSTVAAC